MAGPCKHKAIIAHAKNIPSFDVIPTNSPAMRQQYMFLATGAQTDLSWFLPKQAPAPVGNQETLEVRNKIVQQSSDNEDAENVFQNISSLQDIEAVKGKLKLAFNMLSDKLTSRLESDIEGYAKAVSVFEKTVQKLPSTSDSALQKCLHSFGKSVTQVFFLRLFISYHRPNIMELSYFFFFMCLSQASLGSNKLHQ